MKLESISLVCSCIMPIIVVLIKEYIKIIKEKKYLVKKIYIFIKELPGCKIDDTNRKNIFLKLNEFEIEIDKILFNKKIKKIFIEIYNTLTLAIHHGIDCILNENIFYKDDRNLLLEFKKVV